MGWNRVLTLEFNGKKSYVKRITNTSEAAACLLTVWPRKSGYFYLRAVKGCTRALKGELDDADARFYFLDAARDQGLRVQVSLGPSVLEPFDLEIAQVCDEIAFAVPAPQIAEQ